MYNEEELEIQYICISCGNCSKFTGEQSYKESGIDKLVIVTGGHVPSCEDRIVENWEYGEIENVRCYECQNKVIKIKSEEDIRNILLDEDILQKVKIRIKKELQTFDFFV